MRTLLFTVVAFLIFGSLSIAVADEADKAELARLFPKGAHRLQMSYTYLNAAEADFAIWVPSYSWAYSRRLRVTVSPSARVLLDYENRARCLSLPWHWPV